MRINVTLVPEMARGKRSRRKLNKRSTRTVPHDLSPVAFNDFLLSLLPSWLKDSRMEHFLDNA